MEVFPHSNADCLRFCWYLWPGAAAEPKANKNKNKETVSAPTLEQWHFILLQKNYRHLSISALVSAASPPNWCVNLPCIDHVRCEEVKLSLWASFYIATAYRADLSQRDEDGFHIKSTSHRCGSHLKCTSLLRAAHSSRPDRVFVYFLPCHFPKRHSEHITQASQLIISTRALQIQLGPFHAISLHQQPKIILGAAVIYYTTLTSPPRTPLFPFPCHEPSRLRLPDKLTEVADNSFDSKLQPCVVPRAPLAGVCCDRRARRSSPTVISVGPMTKISCSASLNTKLTCSTYPLTQGESATVAPCDTLLICQDARGRGRLRTKIGNRSSTSF